MRDYLLFAISTTLLAYGCSAVGIKRAAIEFGGFGLSLFAHGPVANLAAVSVAAVAPGAHDKHSITLHILALNEAS